MARFEESASQSSSLHSHVLCSVRLSYPRQTTATTVAANILTLWSSYFFRTRDRVVAMVSPILLEYLIQICYWKRNSLTEKFASFISNNARLFFCHQIFYSLVPGKLKCSSLLPDQSSLLFSLKKKLKEVMYIQIYASDKNRHFLLKRFFFILLLLITLSPYLFYSWQINLLFG